MNDLEIKEVGKFWKCDFCGDTFHESNHPLLIADPFAEPLMACSTCFLKLEN